jgi:hypothetical protein
MTRAKERVLSWRGKWRLAQLFYFFSRPHFLLTSTCRSSQRENWIICHPLILFWKKEKGINNKLLERECCYQPATSIIISFQGRDVKLIYYFSNTGRHLKKIIQILTCAIKDPPPLTHVWCLRWFVALLPNPSPLINSLHKHDSKQRRYFVIAIKPWMLHVWRLWSSSWAFPVQSLPIQISTQVPFY